MSKNEYLFFITINFFINIDNKIICYCNKIHIY